MIGENIKRLRMSLGISQVELACRLNVTKQSVSIGRIIIFFRQLRCLSSLLKFSRYLPIIYLDWMSDAI